jgi:hypothetical protein
VIDLARNQTRVLQAGGQTVPMTSQTLKLAGLTGEGTPGWKSEGQRRHGDLGPHVRQRDADREDAHPRRDALRRAVGGRRPVQRGHHRPVVRRSVGGRAGPRRATRNWHEPGAERRAEHLRRDRHDARRERREHRHRNGVRLAPRRRRRDPGQRVRPVRAHSGAAHLDLAEQAARGHHIGISVAATQHAADAHHEIDPGQPDDRHQHRHQRDLHRRLVCTRRWRCETKTS